jgi:hypothetical protein
MKITARNSEIMEEASAIVRWPLLVIGYILCLVSYVTIGIGKGFYILRKKNAS